MLADGNSMRTVMTFLLIRNSNTNISKPVSHLAHMACLPPSIGIVAPVMKLASLEARNAMV